VNLNVTNNCLEKDMTFRFAVGKSSNITEILPGSFSLDPQSSRSVKIDCEMPVECKENQRIPFTFTLIALDDEGVECEREVITFYAYCDDCTCCDISIYPYPKNITQVCAGETGRYTMVVENKCKSETKTVQLGWSRSSGISAINPSSLTLKPGEKKNIILTYTMPSCKVGAVNKFYFTAAINDCEQVTSSFSITCKNCVCCDVEAISLRIPKSMKAGASSTGMYYIRNGCNKSITVTLTPIANITYIKPTTLTLKAGEKKSITLGLKMPTPKGTIHLKYATFKFKMSVAGCDDQEVSFRVSVTVIDLLHPFRM